MLASSVADASVLVDAVADPDARGAAARDALRGRRLSGLEFTDAEVLSGFRRLALTGELTELDLHLALTDYRSLRLQRFPMWPLRTRVLQLRDNLTAYDAAYVALAESLDVPLVTADARLAAAPGIGCDVVLVRP